MNGEISSNDAADRISSDILVDVRFLIEDTRRGVAGAVNAGMTLLYWRIGERIRQDILKGNRTEYGKQILATLSQELTCEYGNGYSYTALSRMVKFAEVFPDLQNVSTLSRLLILPQQRFSK